MDGQVWILPPSGKLDGYHYYRGGGCEDVRIDHQGWAWIGKTLIL